MEEDRDENFKIMEVVHPNILNDPRIQAVKKQYHDALIELREAVKAYNQIIQKLNKECEGETPS